MIRLLFEILKSRACEIAHSFPKVCVRSTSDEVEKFTFVSELMGEKFSRIASEIENSENFRSLKKWQVGLFRFRTRFFSRLFGAGFECDPEILAAEGSFESILEFSHDGFFRFLAAPDASAGSEVFDRDEHDGFLNWERELWNGQRANATH